MNSEPTNDGQTVRCAGCGIFSYPEDRYCACCGTTLHELCPRCQAPIIHPVAHFCTSCGQRLATDDVVLRRR